jgi:galactose-6-phosphate isomerase
MPLLDVTEVLADPDLADTFSVLRRTETINASGEVVVTSQQINGVVGVVTAGSESLSRGEDFQSLTKTLSVTTTFRLQGPSPGRQPDIVLWGGSQFLVTFIDDFTHFGKGHVEAECVSMTFLDPPPGQGV